MISLRVNVILNDEIFDHDFTEDLKIKSDYDYDYNCEQTIYYIAATGRLLGELEEAVILEEANFKKWKALTVQNILDENPKLAEWKAKNQLETFAKYTTFKKVIADLKKNVKAVEAINSAFKHKSNFLRENNPTK